MKKAIIEMLVIAYVCISILIFMFGIVDGMSENSSCKSKHKHGEYILPWYRVGCFLGESSQ